jgi:O-antigen/teichoic acid export membrane protein
MLVHLLVLLFVLRGQAASIRIAGFITLLAIPASLASQYGLAIIQGKGRFATFNVLRLSQVAPYVTGVLALFLLNSHSVLPVAIVWTLGYLAAGMTALAVGLALTWDAHESVDSDDLVRMIRFGLKGFLGGVLPIETLPLDQMVVALFLTKDALGLYVVALAFINLPRFISQSVGMVAYPVIAGQQMNAKTARRSLWAFFWLTVLAAVVTVVPLWLAAGWLVPFFFGAEFGSAVAVTRILLLGALFAAVRRILGDGLRGRGYAAAGTVAEVASWFWLAPALAILVPLWGLNGVAAALSGSYAVSLGVLLALAAAHSELRLPAALAVSPRAAWRWLRLFATPRLP